MHRFCAPLALALLCVQTAASAAGYTAVPIVQTPPQRIHAADISWVCGVDACQGNTEESRPLVLCQDLAARTGRLASFLADGRAFTVAELERCNSRAKSALHVRAN